MKIIKEIKKEDVLRYINLGKTDIKVSVIGLGTFAIGGWNWGGIEVSDAIDAIKSSIDNGVNFIDTAPIYGNGLSEELVGKAIKGMRDKVVLATKCGLVFGTDKGEFFFEYEDKGKVHKYLGPESIVRELEVSLKRLGTDYIDLYQTHWQDPSTPIEATMEALLKLKSQGKIRAIGVSNVSMEQLKAYTVAGEIASDQEMYSMMDRDVEKDILPWCKANDITFLAYSPLSRGLLTGKITEDHEFKDGDSRKEDPRFSKENRKKVSDFLNKIEPVVKNYDMNYGQAAISWAFSQYDNVVALCGARNEAQTLENIKAGKFLLTKEELDLVNIHLEKYNFS